MPDFCDGKASTRRLRRNCNGPRELRGKHIHESGMGMGLSIGRAIIQTHNGKIWLDESGPGKTVFCIKLPLLKQSHD